VECRRTEVPSSQESIATLHKRDWTTSPATYGEVLRSEIQLGTPTDLLCAIFENLAIISRVPMLCDASSIVRVLEVDARAGEQDR
jgi:hypothetical protein